MIIRLSSLSRILAVLFLIVAVMPAQRSESGELTAEQIQAMRGARQNAAKANKQKALGKEEGEGGADAESSGKWATMTPEERLAANTRRGSKAHCRFVAVCRPPKLLPGQSGTLIISAILQGKSVLPSPLQMTMTPRVKLGSVSIGNLVAHPALPGTIAKAYLGRPVYENTAVFEVPVTMGKDVKIGEKTSVTVDLQFDVYDGDSGRALGRYIERVTTDVDVAPHVDPPIAGRQAKQEDEPEPVAVAPTETTDSEAAANPDSKAMSGTAAVVVPTVAPEPVDVDESATSGELPPTDGDSLSISIMLTVVGGALLLGIIALRMRKK
jgi:hypothetical protein